MLHTSASSVHKEIVYFSYHKYDNLNFSNVKRDLYQHLSDQDFECSVSSFEIINQLSGKRSRK